VLDGVPSNCAQFAAPQQRKH